MKLLSSKNTTLTKMTDFNKYKAVAVDTLKTTASSVQAAFTAHPKKAGETYLEHMKQSMYLSLMSLFCFVVFLVHAVFPMILQTTGSDMSITLHDRVLKRREKVQEIQDKET